MPRYIDADALREKVLYHADTMNHAGNHEQAKAFNYCLCIIDDMPTADVVEVKHGEWIDGLDIPKEERERHPYVYLHGEIFCSVCYKEAYFDTDYGQQLFDYCPNCGTKMGDSNG